ncbi:hypothetical protein PC110_g3794 [Phytophthora cactorum]|uniref:Uncharacterized protein n=1 Tax=Phytophthora cactorum TaxID=29920 RepID=A0A329SU21_9STRA|nr:hypothetical protein PC110_g3794 [Phytophthora cactorum]
MEHLRPVERNLAAELDEVVGTEDGDEEHGVAHGNRPPLIPKTMGSADAPSANKVLARLGKKMRTRSEWMMMSTPVAQGKWQVLGLELTQPVRGANINQLVEETALLLRVMGYRCNSRSNSLILSDWGLSRAAAQLWQWKKKLMPPETKKREVFRAAEGTPYFEDFHIQTTMKARSVKQTLCSNASKSSRYSYWGDPGDSVKDFIRHLSFDRTEENITQYLKIHSHTSLDKIAEFDGKRNRSNASLQWLKSPFSLCLRRVAKGWYRQLLEKAQSHWNLLSEAFWDYYWSQFDQSAYPVREGCADAGDHVEHFLLHGGDDDVLGLIYLLQLEDIAKVEQTIHPRILDEKCKKQRDRL